MNRSVTSINMQQSRQGETRNSNSTNGSDGTNQFGDDLWETPDDGGSNAGLQQQQGASIQQQQQQQQQLQQVSSSTRREQEQQQSMPSPSPSTSASSVINSLQGLMMDNNASTMRGRPTYSNVNSSISNSNNNTSMAGWPSSPFGGTCMEQQQQQQQQLHSTRMNLPMNVVATSNRRNDTTLQSFPPSADTTAGRSGMQLFHQQQQQQQQQHQQQQLTSSSQFQQFATLQQQHQQLRDTNDLLRRIDQSSSTFAPASTNISFGTAASSDPFEPSSIIGGANASSHPSNFSQLPGYLQQQQQQQQQPSDRTRQGNPFADAGSTNTSSGMTNVAVQQQQGMSHGRISPSRRFTWAAGSSRSNDSTSGGDTSSSVTNASLLKAFMNNPPNNNDDRSTVNSVTANATGDSYTNHNAIMVNRQRDLLSRPSSAPIDTTTKVGDQKASISGSSFSIGRTKQTNTASSNPTNEGPASTLAFDPNMPFPVKLHHILSQEGFSESVTWLSHGRAWRVMKPQLFEKQVMARFFRSAKYASFMRQVNGWGFRRILSGPDINAYYHELFLRGLPNLCVKMKRLPRGQEALSRAARDVPLDGGAPDFYRMHKLSPLPTVQKGKKRRSSSSSRGSAPASAMPFTMKRAESVAQQNNSWLESILTQTQNDVPIATSQLQALMSEDDNHVTGTSPHQPAPLSLANQAYLVSQNRVLLDHVTRMQEQLDELDAAAQSVTAESKTSTRQPRSP